MSVSLVMDGLSHARRAHAARVCWLCRLSLREKNRESACVVFGLYVAARGAPRAGATSAGGFFVGTAARFGLAAARHQRSRREAAVGAAAQHGHSAFDCARGTAA